VGHHRCHAALLVVYGTKIEPIEKVLKDIDWKTLIFLLCMFCLVEAVTRQASCRAFH